MTIPSVPLTMSGAICGGPLGVMALNTTWLYVSMQDVSEQSAGLMRASTKSADMMSVRGRSGGLLTIRQK